MRGKVEVKGQYAPTNQVYRFSVPDADHTGIASTAKSGCNRQSKILESTAEGKLLGCTHTSRGGTLNAF